MQKRIEVFKKPPAFYRYKKAKDTVNALIRLVNGKQCMLGRENLKRLNHAFDLMVSSKSKPERKQEIASKSITASLDRDVEYLGVIQLTNVLDSVFKGRKKEFAIDLIKQYIDLKGSEVHEVDKRNLLSILKEIRDDLDMNQKLNR